MTKTYSELISYPTFDERFAYANLNGRVAEETFGYDRYINQALYTSEEWRRFRKSVILRDNGCDLACEGFEIIKFGIIHHLNPITKQDILERRPCVFDFENVILVSPDTHRAIHYGAELKTQPVLIERRPNDTCPWK